MTDHLLDNPSGRGRGLTGNEVRRSSSLRELIDDRAVREKLRRWIGFRLRRSGNDKGQPVDPEKVSDIFQDTILMALSKESSFRPELGGFCWLKRISSNLIYKRGRVRRREVQFPGGLDRAAICPPESEDESIRVQNRDSLIKAIGRLKPKHRLAIRLSWFGNLDGKELAKALAVPTVGAARVRKHRAMEELQREFSAVRIGRR
jgi:RNA polymerase sigma factor (sigma-70 family)